MSYDLIIKNAEIPQGDRKVAVEILVKNGKISALLAPDSGVPATNSIDALGNLVLPGCIDPHTHMNDPGFTHREDFFTGTSAAAAGGLTTIIDMPCSSLPAVRSAKNIQTKLEHIKEKALIDYALWGGITGEDIRNNSLHIIDEQIGAGVCAFKVYMTASAPTYPGLSDGELLECFTAISKTGLPIGVHAENLSICDFYVQKLRGAGRTDAPAWAEARKELAEKIAIELCISLAEETDARLHIVHMSTGVGAKLVGDAKKRGLNITSEVCPQHLTLNAIDSMTKFGSLAKIAPPLRTIKDIEALWEGLMSGTVDFVATDHAPLVIDAEKLADGMDIWSASPGMPGVEFMVPIIISEGYNRGRLSLSRLVEVLSKNAAIHYGLYPKKGALEIGSDADFTIIDLDREWTIDKDKMHGKCKFTPFHGMKLKGKVTKTVVRGTLVFDEVMGIVGEPGFGKFVERQTISKLRNNIFY